MRGESERESGTRTEKIEASSESHVIEKERDEISEVRVDATGETKRRERERRRRRGEKESARRSKARQLLNERSCVY